MGTKASGAPPGEGKPDPSSPPHRPPVVVADTGRGFYQGRRSRTATETATTTGVLPRRDGGVTEMLGRKRLMLVLDLDHTLLHSIHVRGLSPQELYLLREPNRVEGEGQRPLLFDLRRTSGFLIKLRPFIHTFLREASTMYDFYICTNGSRAYAGDMARILDPDRLYFSSDNVISRWDFTVKGKKGLDVVRRGDERTSIILDDTVDVWEKKHRDNLVQISPYHYFSCSRETLGPSWRSPSELRTDETTGALPTTLDLLRLVHRRFFDGSSQSDLSTRDVRPILKEFTQKKQEKKDYDDGNHLPENDHLPAQPRDLAEPPALSESEFKGSIAQCPDFSIHIQITT